MKSSIWFFIPIMALAFSLRAPFLAREFVLEEGIHVKVAKAILDTGLSIVYLGEQQGLTPFLDRPPGLFLFILPFLKIFGESETAARLTPMVFGVAEILLVLFFVNRLFQKSYCKAVGFMTAFFMAIHPYLIQTSLQVHFDQIYSFFSTLFLFLSLEKILKSKTTWKDFIPIAITFMLALSIKYDPALILLAIVISFAFFQNRAFIAKFILSVISSALIFFSLFYVYNILIGNPNGFWIPIRLIWWVIQTNLLFKLTHLELSSAIRSSWANNYYLLIRFLSWLSIPVILLSFYSFLSLLIKRRFFNNPKVFYLLVWFSFYCFFYLLVGWAGDYPRYFTPAMPPLFILISISLFQIYSNLKKHFPIKLIFISLVASLLLLLLGQIKGWLFLDHITGWVPQAQIAFFIILLTGIIFIIVLIKTRQFNYLLPLVLVYLSIGQFTIQYIHDFKSDYSLTNFYGVSGSRDAARFLKDQFHGQDDIIFTFDPIAYYWQGRYFDFVNSTNKLHMNEQQLVDIFKNGRIVAIALPEVYINNLSDILKRYDLDFMQLLSQNYPNYQHFGNKMGIEVYYK